MTHSSQPHLTSLTRHFHDLRDGTHGGVRSRLDKESIFAAAVTMLDWFARQVLWELNDVLMLGRGTVATTGLVADASGGMSADWSLSWPEQRSAGIQPVIIRAFYGSGFHHPHLRGGTVGDWPLNVYNVDDAAAELSTLRAIASADLHNLVFQADYRIIPALG
ncbi:MAG: hypothetical protein ABIQ09_09175 [Jatrophihabitantaceae bacterium]